MPPTTGTLNCNTAVWIDADDDASAAGYYRPGDRVCYRVQLVLEDTGAPVPVGTELQYRDVVVADYLPPGMVFEQFWGTNAATGETTGDTIVDVNTLTIENTSAGQLITWELGTDTPDGRFVDAAAEPFFEVVFSATLPIASYPIGRALLARQPRQGHHVQHRRRRDVAPRARHRGHHPPGAEPRQDPRCRARRPSPRPARSPTR